MREINEDAKDLQSDTFEVGDTNHRMRKVSGGSSCSPYKFNAQWDIIQLLRKFSDIVASTSLEEDEECSICMEKMLPNKAKR